MQKNLTQDFSAGVITLIDQNVVMIKYDYTIKITRSHLLEVQEVIRGMIGEKEFFAIFDFTDGMPGYTGQAKSFAAISKESNEFRIMDVVIAYNWRTRIDVMIYKRLYKPKKRIVTVDNLNEAVKLIDKEKSELMNSVSMAG